MVVTSLIAITGVSMVYSLFRRVTWRRLLCLATLGSNSHMFALTREPRLLTMDSGLGSLLHDDGGARRRCASASQPWS